MENNSGGAAASKNLVFGLRRLNMFELNLRSIKTNRNMLGGRGGEGGNCSTENVIWKERKVYDLP